jgi:hypothetical protein
MVSRYEIRNPGATPISIEVSKDFARIVEIGQIISGARNRPSAEMHSTAVTRVRLTVVPLQLVRILRELNTQQDTRLVHAVDIPWNNGRIMKLLVYDAKPVHHLVVDIVIMSCPVQHLDSSRFKLRMTFIEALWPILAWWPNTIVHVMSLESGGSLTCDHKG